MPRRQDRDIQDRQGLVPKCRESIFSDITQDTTNTFEHRLLNFNVGLLFLENELLNRKVDMSDFTWSTFSSRVTDGNGSFSWKQNPSELITPGDPEALFQIEAQLGEGSFGVVYRARCNEGGCPVAVKALPVYENCLQSAAHELKILRECEHPNIVGYYGVFLLRFLRFPRNRWSKMRTGTWSKDCNLWIVMELCVGGR